MGRDTSCVVTVYCSPYPDDPIYGVMVRVEPWHTVGMVKNKVNELISGHDDYPGEGELVWGLADNKDGECVLFPDDDVLWTLDGWDPNGDDQYAIAITEGCNSEYWAAVDRSGIEPVMMDFSEEWWGDYQG